MDKQIEKYPYKEMPLSNKNEWSSHSNLDESQNNSAEWKEQDIKEYKSMILFIWSSRKCKLIYSNWKQIGGCLETVKGQQAGDKKKVRVGKEASVYSGECGDGMCTLVNVVMVSWVYTYIKNY